MGAGSPKEEIENSYEDPDPSKFQSVDLALDEIRRRYDDEEQRRSSIDNKSIGLASLDGVIASILSLRPNVEIRPLTGIALLFLIISVVIMLVNIRKQAYDRPFSLTGHIYAYADDSAAEFNSQTFELYRECVLQNQVINNQKYERFQWGFLLAVAAIIVVCFSTLIQFHPG